MGRPALPQPAPAGRALPLLFVLALALFLAVPAGAAPDLPERSLVAPTVDGRLPLMIRTDDPAGVADRVVELGGEVLHVFTSIGAVSAQLAPEALADLKADPRVQQARRQHLVRRAIVPSRLPDVPGYTAPRRVREGRLTLDPPTQPMAMRTVPLEKLADEAHKTGPQSFFGYDVLTGAADSWEATGFGEGVNVAIIDTGVYPQHPMYAGNVVGGFNLVPMEEELLIDHDGDNVPDNRSFGWDALENDGHGTLVAGIIAGHVDLDLPSDDPLLLSIAANTPESVTDGGEGISTVRLMGLAPGASLFGVKVFPYDGGSAPDARVAEAIDRLVEMKRTGAFDVDVINMSLSGPVLFDGWNPLDRMVDAATDAGITVVSAASNDGPTIMSVGSPASAFTGLSAGGVSDPIHARVAIETFFGAPPGFGATVYPHEEPIMVDFASRGPTADRRGGVSLVASAFFVFSSALFDIDQDGLNDAPGFTFASGTSFAAPAVSGAAALVTAYGDKLGRFNEAPFVANALRGGAAPIADFRAVSQHHQGRGFVNVVDALRRMDAGRVYTAGSDDLREVNVAELDLRNGSSASGQTPLLAAGEQFDFLVKIPRDASRLKITFPVVTKEKEENPVLGDGITGAVHTAKRGGSGDYVFYKDGLFEPLSSGDTFELDYPEPGTARITVVGSFTNYGRISAAVEAEIEMAEIEVAQAFGGYLERDEMAFHEVEVPAGVPALGIRLSWKHDWSQYPTYDLDMFIETPDGFLPAASLDSPELALIENPTPGTYRFAVLDFSTVLDREPYRVELVYFGAPGREPAGSVALALPRLGEASPNPTRGSSELAFSLPRAEEAKLRVFDVSGRLVRTLVNGPMEAGSHRVAWDGRTDGGLRAAGGVYFLRLETENASSTRKVTLLK